MVSERELAESWVVYGVFLAGEAGPTATCEQAVWDAMSRVEPRRYKLIFAGITTEAEAERLARAAMGSLAVRG